MIRKLTSVGLLAALASLVLATTSLSADRQLTGTFPSDPDATVSMTVKVSAKGKPKKITGFTYSGLTGFCNEAALDAPTTTVESIKIEKQDSGNKVIYFFEENGQLPSGDGYGIDGEVKRNGKKVEGRVLHEFHSGDCLEGGTGPVRFNAS